MTELLHKLNSPELAVMLIMVIPIILKLATKLKLDVSKLPKWAQPLPGLALAFLGSLLALLQGGKTLGDAALILVLGWAGAGGAYHYVKRWISSRTKPPVALRSSSALLLLLIPLMAGWSSPGCTPQPSPVDPTAIGGSPGTGGAGTGGLINPFGGSTSTGGQPSGGSGGLGTGGTQPTEAELLCSHIEAIGCPEGKLVDCPRLVELYQSDDRFSLDVDCLFLATNQQQARACGSLSCGGVQ